MNIDAIWIIALVVIGAVIASRSGKRKGDAPKGQPVWGWTANAIDRLFFWQDGHCEGAFMREWDRRQLPGVFRD